ncbi:phosphatidylglycerol lysyltransferase domain-containing protein [Terrisporobacter glycolicus]|nr:phosphatidylglycerol lysyltransferase domain-containing protein [Terrisporobacter glycolicus]
MIFKNINMESREMLNPYFDLVDYEACEYCFNTLYMWQHLYKTGYYIGDGFAVIVAEYEGNTFSILPLAKKEDMPRVIQFVVDYFEKEQKKIYFRGITQEVVDFLKENYPGKFNYIEERDLFDYVYDGESMRELKGRKNVKKRNHINYFKKEYEGRYEYRLLDEKDFDACLELVQEWTSNKEENNAVDEEMEEELIGIKKLFENYGVLKDKLKIAGIFIDGKLEAFTMGEYINPNMALIHIEKANPVIRGLYPFINQQFLVHEFSDAEFVNREEDLGIEGLRKAKLSYHPVRFVEKYTVREV